MKDSPTPSRRALLGAATLLSANVAAAVPRSSGPATPPTLDDATAINVRAFGAKGDGSTDDSDAIQRAVAAATEQRRELLFPAGTYVHGRTLRLDAGGLHVRGSGGATLKYVGNGGVCVSVDPGDQTIVYDHRLQDIIIDGNGRAEVGLFIRNAAHSLRRNIIVRNVSDVGFAIYGDVLSLYESCRVSDNEGEFVQVPAIDWLVTRSRANSSTTACLFVNCMAEAASQFGWLIDEASQNVWIGGTSEGLVADKGSTRLPIGLAVGKKASGNSFIGFFCELNSGGDLKVEGPDNLFTNCTFTSAAPESPYERIKSVVVSSGAVGNRFEGGTAFALLVEKGAQCTTFRHIEARFRIFDSGTGTVIEDCRQLYNSNSRFPSRTFGNVEDPNPLALDWYEELRPQLRLLTDNGAVVKSATVSAQATRIGNLVQFAAELAIAPSSAVTGRLRIAGLPFEDRIGFGQAVGRFGDSMVIGMAQQGAGGLRLSLIGSERNLNEPTRLSLSGQYFVTPAA